MAVADRARNTRDVEAAGLGARAVRTIRENIETIGVQRLFHIMIVRMS